MPALKKRLGASIFLSVLSLVTIVLLLPTSRVSDQLQKIGLPTSIDNYWNWGDQEDGKTDEEDAGGGIQMVVFGDSWVDRAVENGDGGIGKSYVEILCDEINCTSCLNYAVSQPGTDFPANPATGVMTSNMIHAAAINSSQEIPAESKGSTPLPDFTAQVNAYLDLPARKEMPEVSIFVISFGFWDVYDFARLDYELSKKVTDSSVAVIFAELNRLYDHFVKTYQTFQSSKVEEVNSTSTTPQFHVIIPKLFDPTLLPGWISDRPLPLSPSSVAEQHKNAVYLTARWNLIMENKMTAWVNDVLPKESVKVPTPQPNTEASTKAPTKAPIEKESLHADVREDDKSKSGFIQDASVPVPVPLNDTIEKDIIYYDLPGLLLDLIIEHQLEDEGLQDASGLGKGESPFQSVYQPCVREAESLDTDGYVDLNGMLVCKEPEEYLWWDSWTLGKTAKEMIGREIGSMVTEGKTLKNAWDKAAKSLGH